MVEIELRDLGQSFGGRTIFRGISARFQPGTVTAVTGANGSGKSTLLRLVAKLALPSEGEVLARDKENGQELGKAAYRERLALLAPELRFYPRLTAWENLHFLLGLRDVELGKDDYLLLLERVGLDEKKMGKALVGEFSTGMRQRLKLAALLASGAEVWLLDEPGANLDEAGRALVLNESRRAATEGRLVLWATNDAREEAAADARIDLGRH